MSAKNNLLYIELEDNIDGIKRYKTLGKKCS